MHSSCCNTSSVETLSVVTIMISQDLVSPVAAESSVVCFIISLAFYMPLFSIMLMEVIILYYNIK